MADAVDDWYRTTPEHTIQLGRLFGLSTMLDFNHFPQQGSQSKWTGTTVRLTFAAWSLGSQVIARPRKLIRQSKTFTRKARTRRLQTRPTPLDPWMHSTLLSPPLLPRAYLMSSCAASVRLTRVSACVLDTLLLSLSFTRVVKIVDVA